MSTYVAPHQTVSQGTLEPVRVVAFQLGTCRTGYMYRAVEWYFPQHGQTFNPNRFADICIGAYWPLHTGSYINGPPNLPHHELTLIGTPTNLHGSINYQYLAILETFRFTGSAEIDGTITLHADTGHTYTGTWGADQITLANCTSYLKTPPNKPMPSCMFHWNTTVVA